MCAQTVQADEYSLVDGGSTDSTVAMAEKCRIDYSIPLRIISGNRLNIAQGYNEGLKVAKNEIIIITGIGNKYDRFFFEELLRFSDENDIVYGLTKGQNNSLFARVYNELFLHGEKGIIFRLPSNRGCLIKKDVTKKIGYFYEKFIYAGEDTEYYRRAKAEGIRIFANDRAIIYWETPKTWREFCKQRKVYYIGRMQHTGVGIKDFLAYVYVCMMILWGILLFIKPLTVWPYLLVVFVYVFLGYKLKTINVLALLLYIYDLISPSWLLPQFYRYSKEKYKVDR